MKTLLILVIITCSYNCFSQDTTILKFTTPFKIVPKNFQYKNKNILDSLRAKYNSYQNNMPNAFIGKLSEPKLIGNNGNGQNIYQLPIDKMPLIQPDSTYHFKMPVAGRK